MKLNHTVKAWLLFAGILLCAPASAQPPATPMPGITLGEPDTISGHALQCRDPAASMLWQVKSAALDSRGIDIHLFGSIHVGKPEFYPLHPALEALFRKADNLVFEVDPQIAGDPQVALQMQLRGMLPPDQTLENVVSENTMAQLQDALGSMGLPAASFMHIKPWMIALLLTNFQASALGYNAQYGLESYLLEQKSSQSHVLQLESLQLQIDMLDALDPEVFLSYSLQEFSSSASMLHNMVRAWQCGDRQALAQIVFAGENALEQATPAERQQLESLYQKLFIERNKTMAAGIEQFARTGAGSYFVVVGSGHLLGAGSVVELLQQQGFEVTPVRLAP